MQCCIVVSYTQDTSSSVLCCRILLLLAQLAVSFAHKKHIDKKLDKHRVAAVGMQLVNQSGCQADRPGKYRHMQSS